MRNQGRLDDALAYFRNAAQLVARELPYTWQTCVKARNNQGQTRDRNRVTEVLAMIQDMGER
jgi:hypothetical protein